RGVPGARQMRDSPLAHADGCADGRPAGGDDRMNEGELRERVVRMLRTVHDPEIPVNIYDLGLVYAIDIDESNVVSVKMTLTAPGCPVAPHLVETVQDKLMKLDGVSGASVELVWEPPWTRERMSPAARLHLGLL